MVHAGCTDGEGGVTLKIGLKFNSPSLGNHFTLLVLSLINLYMSFRRNFNQNYFNILRLHFKMVDVNQALVCQSSNDTVNNI